MHVQNLKLPVRLGKLTESGTWPTGISHSQELKPILGKEAASKLSADDDYIVLKAPPFHTIADEVRKGSDFWTHGVTNADEIDYEKAVIIADFGIGSDSAIILYYRILNSPSIMYLRWIGNGKDVRHQWIETHASFDDFVEDIGLYQTST